MPHDELIQTAMKKNIPAGFVYTFCQSRGSSRMEAEDTANESSTYAYVKSLSKRFDSQDHFDAWVTTVGKRKAIEIWRKGRFPDRQSDASQNSSMSSSDRPSMVSLTAFDGSLPDRAERYQDPIPILELGMQGMYYWEKSFIYHRFIYGTTLDELAYVFFPPDDRTDAGRRSRVFRISADLLQRIRVKLEGLGYSLEDCLPRLQ